MKVAFFIHSLEVSGCRYRVLQYLPYLKEHGVDPSIHFYRGKWVDRLKFYTTLDHFDVLYVHRKLFSPVEFWYLRKKAKKIIYDFDDAVMYRSSTSKNPYSPSRHFKFGYMMRRVDYIIAGNQFLKSEARRYNRNVVVVPTTIDLSRYTLKEDFHHGGPITIGWLGSSSTLKYLKRLIPTLEAIFRKCPKVQLKIVCDQFLESSVLPVIRKAWSSEEEEADLKSFDIGIMPLSDDPWSRGKCGFKIVQYFGVGLPVVCTPVGMNRDIVEDGVNGFWAQSEEEWEDRLLQLIEAEALRREMGLRGRKAAEQSYSLEVNAPRIFDALKRVLPPEEKST